MSLQRIGDCIQRVVLPKYSKGEFVCWDVITPDGSASMAGCGCVIKKVFIKTAKDVEYHFDGFDILFPDDENEDILPGWFYLIDSEEFEEYFWIAETGIIPLGSGYYINTENADKSYEEKLSGINSQSAHGPNFATDDLVRWDSLDPQFVHIPCDAYDLADIDFWENADDTEDYREVEITFGYGVIEDLLWLEDDESKDFLEESLSNAWEQGNELLVAIPSWYKGWVYEVFIADEFHGNYTIWIPEECLTLAEKEKPKLNVYQFSFLPPNYPAIDLTVPLSLWERILFDPKKWARHQEFELEQIKQ